MVISKSAWMACVACAGSAIAGDSGDSGVEIVYPVGAESWDLLGDPDNDVRLVDLAAWMGLPSGTPLTLIGLGWDVHLSTVGTSWLSEIRAQFTDPDGSGGPDENITLSAGAKSSEPGTLEASSDGIVVFADSGIAPLVLSTGVMRLEFFERFDDVADEIDGRQSGRYVLLIEGTSPDSCGVADLAPPLGQLDAADLTRFVDAFTGADPIADTAVPAGVFDLADIVTFVTAFNGGCP